MNKGILRSSGVFPRHSRTQNRPQSRLPRNSLVGQYSFWLWNYHWRSTRARMIGSRGAAEAAATLPEHRSDPGAGGERGVAGQGDGIAFGQAFQDLGARDAGNADRDLPPDHLAALKQEHAGFV